MTDNPQKYYSLADILGSPISEAEAQAMIEKDNNSYLAFQKFDKVSQDKLLNFIMGKRGLAITYDPVFHRVMLPGSNTERLEMFLSSIMEQPISIQEILPRKGSTLVETGSFVIADIIVRLSDGTITTVEIQKIGYDFPGERCSCYTADMIMRQYIYVKDNCRKKDQKFSYGNMRPVHLIILMEHSPDEFRQAAPLYLHRKISSFDTGINVTCLENVTFISLDTFNQIVHNVNTEQDAWLKFLTSDDPDEIVSLVNKYPIFLDCYRDIVAFRQEPKELIYMFSDALREMDHNTEVYMNNKLRQKVDELTSENSSLLTENASQAAQLEQKDALIAQLQAELANKK